MHVRNRRVLAPLAGLAVALVAASSASATPTVTIEGGGTVAEGGTGTFVVKTTWIAQDENPPTFVVGTSNGSAVRLADFNDPSPTGGGSCSGLKGQPCHTEFPYEVQTVTDDLDEEDETFSATVTPTSQADVLSGQTAFTIADDDAAPTVSISDVTVAENVGAARFTVSLSVPTGRQAGVDVPWTTAPRSATAGADYAAASGTVHFNPGETTQTVPVPIVDDNITEPQESFVVDLGAPSNATLADGEGEARINDNDAPPVVKIDGDSVTEGNVGTANAKLEVELSHPTAFPVDVTYRTSDGTAHAGEDYESRTGTVHFDPMQTEKDVRVAVDGDTTDEPDETFDVRLSNAVNATLRDDDGKATIKDDDAPPTASIGNASVTEGDSGAVQATFTVSLSAASGYTVTVDYATADGTARAGSDYTAEHGTLTFAPGQTRKQVTVAVNGDDAVEADETFSVRLAAPVHVTMAAGEQGLGTIRNDDRAPASESSHSGGGQSGKSGDGARSGDAPKGTPHAKKRRRGPRMRVSIADALAGKSLHLVVACPTAEEVCRGTATLASKRSRHARHARILGVARFKVKGGDSRTVTVKLSRRARAYLAAGHRATATVVARDEDGNVGVTKRGFAL